MGTQKNRLNETVLLSNLDGSFEHPKHMLNLMGDKTISVFANKISLSGSMKDTLTTTSQNEYQTQSTYITLNIVGVKCMHYFIISWQNHRLTVK